MELAAQKCQAERYIKGTVATRRIDYFTFTISVVKFPKHKVENGSVNNAEVEESIVKLCKAVHERKKGRWRIYGCEDALD